MSELEQRKNNFLEKVKPYFTNPYSLCLIGILLLAFTLRIYYINTALQQAVWWDSADYLSAAKIIGGRLATSGGYDWTATRPIFLAFFWGMLYRLGAGELILHLTEIFAAVISIFFTYLLGKELYDKRIGLIASFILSVFYLYTFYTIRLMSDIPALAFWFAGLYFLWRGFIKEEGNKFKILAAVLMSLALFTRAATIISIPFTVLFLVIVKKFRLLKDKFFWYSLIVAFLVFLPDLIFIYFKYGGNPIIKFFGFDVGRFGAASGWPHFDLALTYGIYFIKSLGSAFWIPAIIGSYIFLELFLGFDFILKGKEEAKKLLPHLFLLIWIIIPFSYHTIYAGAAFDERYLFYIYPPIFMLIGHGLMLIYKFINKVGKTKLSAKYVKYISTILVIIILAVGGQAQLKKGDDLIKNKEGSYYQVKLAGLWLKENSEPTDIIISGSRYQNIYYSERDTYNYALERFVSREYVLEQSRIQNISRETHGYLTEEAFDEQIKKLKPRFMTVSIFESHPPWVYTYAQRHPNVKPVQAYFLDVEKKQLALVIYEFTGYEPSKATTK